MHGRAGNETVYMCLQSGAIPWRGKLGLSSHYWLSFCDSSSPFPFQGCLWCVSCTGLSFHKNLGGRTVRIQLVLHTDLVLSLLHIFKFFYWKVSYSVAPLTFLRALYPLASWSRPQNSRLPHDPVCIEGVLGPTPTPRANAVSKHVNPGPGSLLNTWNISMGGEGWLFFLPLHHLVKTSHIPRDTCCLFSHQTGRAGESLPQSLIPGCFPPPSLWLLKGHN